VVSEEKIKMWNVDGQTKSDGNSSQARWAKKMWISVKSFKYRQICIRGHISNKEKVAL